jgi:cytochrome P450
MKLDYEPFSEVAREDPYPLYAELRQRAPVYWAEEAQTWCVSRYADVLRVLRSPEDFSSDAMRTMVIGTRPGSDLNDPESLARLLAIAQALPFPAEEVVTARSLISEDPPRHEEMRAIVNRGFTPRRIAVWETRMRAIVDECIASLRGADRYDVIAELAIPLPVRIIAEILGVEPERHEDFKRWTNQLIAGATGSTRGMDPVANGFAPAISELCQYIQSVVAERKRTPGDDLVSVLVAAGDGAAALSTAEVALFVVLLLAAGNETTTNLIGNAVLALLRHPAELARVRADRRLVPSLVEETLRWDGPVHFVGRRAMRAIEICGQQIPAGAGVLALLGSANRDEREWGPTAATFDVARNPQSHLGFGFGTHFCLGASLARLEARVALESLIDELPHVERCEPRVEYVDSFLVRGPRSLPLRRAA